MTAGERMTGCGCGEPSLADYYMHAVIGRDVPGGTQTSEADGYYCAGHVPGEDDVRQLRADDGWNVLEFTVRRTGGGEV